MQIAQTAGALMSHFGRVRTTLVPNKTWKKELLGNGNASKEDIRTWLIRNHESYAARCEANQDRVDAVCIGIYGCRLHERSEHLDNL
jgi:Holliday junction resolvasome RuvABC endonuclease subunit